MALGPLGFACATLAALAALSSYAAAACDGASGTCAEEDDTTVALQTVRPDAEASARQRLVAASDAVHTVCTCDCGRYCEWPVELLFYSAQRVGQRGPITAVLDGCSQEHKEQIARRHAHLGLPKNYRRQGTRDVMRTHVMNKPLGFAAWFRQVGPERDVVAVAVAMGDDEPGGLYHLHRHAHQRYEVCQDDPGRAPHMALHRDGHRPLSLHAHLFWLYHMSAPPMLAHGGDWDEWLVDSWRDITIRFRKVYHYYYFDMWSWMLANVHHGKRQLIVNTYQLLYPSIYEPWKAVEETLAKVDPCEAPMDEVLANPNLAMFLHYTSHTNAWDKRWFPRIQIFNECNETSTDAYHFRAILQSKVNKSNMTMAFASCVMRRFFAAAVLKSCVGLPTAALFEPMSKGFKL